MSLHVFIQWCILFIHIFRIVQKISLFSLRIVKPRFCMQKTNEVYAGDEGIRFSFFFFFTKQHEDTYQQTVVFMFITLRTSDVK